MKSYKCRMASKKGEWESIEAYSAGDAAEVFAEEYCLEPGSRVIVRGAGTFDIDVEYLYHAYRLQGQVRSRTPKWLKTVKGREYDKSN